MSSDTDIIKMLLLFLLTTHLYHGRIFQQTVNISTGIKWCHHLNDVFLFSLWYILFQTQLDRRDQQILQA
jgi:hypothetical protein